KSMTSLTPGQYQKRLRLIEARRLLLEEGFTASNAAFEVGYESVSQFTREYGRLFEAPPKRDALRYRRPAAALPEDSVPATAAPALAAWSASTHSMAIRRRLVLLGLLTDGTGLRWLPPAWWPRPTSGST